MAMLDSTTDRTADGAMLGRIHPDAPGGREGPQPSHLADPSLFDFSGPAIGTASPHTGPENP
jgi:hypothetical protein